MPGMDTHANSEDTVSFHEATPEARWWAQDEEYLYCDDCGWVDLDDNPVNVQFLYDLFIAPLDD